MEIYAVLFIVLWLISPIVLLVLYFLERQKKKQTEDFLKNLIIQGRTTPYEIARWGIKLVMPPNWQKSGKSGIAAPMEQRPVPMTQPPVRPIEPDGERLVQEELKKLDQLYAEGALTANELQQQKEKLLAVAKPPALSKEAASAAVIEETEPQELQPEETASITEEESSEIQEKKPESESESEFQGSVMQNPVSVRPTLKSAPGYSYTVSEPAKSAQTISAITVMLGVGVILVILAGLLFVRTQWNTLPGFGKLGVLAAGSALFFGVSALAHRMWHLKRTGMAFFSLGTAYFPISIWAAGYFSLLGKGLSGSDNPWLYTLVFGAFTMISAIAVRIYQQLGWGIFTLIGGSLTYLCLMAAVLPAYAPWTLAIALYALVLTVLAPLLAKRLPQAIGKAIEPFALIFTALSALPVLIRINGNPSWYGFAAFAVAAAFLTPTLTTRMRSASAVPMGALTLYGFARVLHPLLENHSLNINGWMYFALICIISSILFLILEMTDSLPLPVIEGYQWMFRLIAGFSLVIMLGYAVSGASWTWISLVAAAFLLAATLLPALRTKSIWLRSYLAAETLVLLFGIGNTFLFDAGNAYLLAAVLCLFFGALYLLCRLLRTPFSDFLFPTAMALSALASIASFSESFNWQILIDTLLLAAAFVAYLYLALEKDTQYERQKFFACLVPIALIFLCGTVSSLLPIRAADHVGVLIWSMLSMAVGFFTYFTTVKRFHAVRRLLFALTIVPSLLLGTFGYAFGMGTVFPICIMLLNALGAGILYRIFANRGFRPLTYASFITMVLLVTETVYYIGDQFAFAYAQGGRSYASAMLSGAVILLLSGFVFTIRRMPLRFVGDYAFTEVMQWIAPAYALLYNILLVQCPGSRFDTVFLLFSIVLTIAAWFMTKPQQYLLPSSVCLSAVLIFHIILKQFEWNLSNTTSPAESALAGSEVLIVVGMVLVVSLLTAVFCYLGRVLYLMQQKRSITLTVTGGIIPLLLWDASGFWMYTESMTDWLRFFVPVLFSLYTLHFITLTQKEEPFNRKGIITASAALMMLALWMQPIFDFNDTYLDGKYHLLPLLCFGIVLRKLYGKQTGGWCLFAIGTYSMIALASGALISNEEADLLTVLICALVIFITAYYFKQKKWFLLGGISLCGVAIRLSPGLQWWVYLLLAGVLLIAIAAINETAKQKGESLKQRVGRFWEDWEW